MFPGTPEEKVKNFVHRWMSHEEAADKLCDQVGTKQQKEKHYFHGTVESLIQQLLLKSHRRRLSSPSNEITSGEKPSAFTKSAWQTLRNCGKAQQCVLKVRMAWMVGPWRPSSSSCCWNKFKKRSSRVTNTWFLLEIAARDYWWSLLEWLYLTLLFTGGQVLLHFHLPYITILLELMQTWFSPSLVSKTCTTKCRYFVAST